MILQIELMTQLGERCRKEFMKDGEPALDFPARSYIKHLGCFIQLELNKTPLLFSCNTILFKADLDNNTINDYDI